MEIKQIMIIDDDKDDSEILAQVLQELIEGAKCEIICGMHFNLEKLLERGIPDFLFMDINLMQVNPYILLQSLIGHEDLRGSRIIVHATSAMLAEHKLGLQQFSLPTLVKSNSYTELVRELHILLKIADIYVT